MQLIVTNRSLGVKMPFQQPAELPVKLVRGFMESFACKLFAFGSEFPTFDLSFKWQAQRNFLNQPR